MTDETATSPAEDGDTEESTATETQEVETEGQETEPQFDDDGNPIEEPDEDEEVELDADLKLKVPKETAARLKELKEGNLRQADYTKKTQEVAELRKAVTAEKEQFQQTTEAELQAFVAAQSVAAQIQQFEKIDWDAWEAQDPFEAQRGYRQYQTALRQHQQAMGQHAYLRNERLSKAQAETQKRQEEGRTALAKEIGWNEDLKARLVDFAAGFGFSRDELSDLEEDPRAAKILHAAFEGAEAKRKSQAAQRHVQAQQVTPAATVKPRSAPPAGLDDRLSAEEWARRRNEQLRKRG